MPYAAITYRVKPGHEDEIAEIFAGFQRVDTPVLRDSRNEQVGRLLGTAVFVKGELMVRVIHYEGDFSAIGKHMAGQRGVHLLEERLAPYLLEKRDTGTAAGFGEYFRNATMRCVSQLSVDTHRGDRAGEFTLAELTEILRASVGVPEGVDLNGDIVDVEFAELGYDSLAVLEMASQVERRYGIPIPDEAVSEMPTPGRAVEFVNARLARAGA
jgi:acyl carrier protein